MSRHKHFSPSLKYLSPYLFVFPPRILFLFLYDDSQITSGAAPMSSCPFQVSVCFNCLHDRMALSEVTARQLGHAAAGVWSACVSDQMINVLFVTVSNYINELFIINAHTDR